MRGAIPNPKKTFTIPFGISKTFDAVQVIAGLKNKYKLTKSNTTFNSCTLEASEFLSLGVYIDFNLNDISDEKTEVTIEVKRKIGSFDESHEVTQANEHIDILTDALSNALTMSDSDIASIKNSMLKDVKPNKNTTKKGWYQSNFLLILAVVFFFPIGIYGLFKRFM
tara:strand:- start:55 stop:555 length:501 start_codon:yes stop_codon:yes gene_type:complete